MKLKVKTGNEVTVSYVNSNLHKVYCTIESLTFNPKCVKISYSEKGNESQAVFSNPDPYEEVFLTDSGTEIDLDTLITMFTNDVITQIKF